MNKIRTNGDRLVVKSVMGAIHHPTVRAGGAFSLGHDGMSTVLPGVGGITYNVKIGDGVFGWAGDHVEPGVSIRNPDERENGALTALACVGNDAVVVSGDAKGARGFVTGFHGGYEHTILYFDEMALEKLLPGDRILIRAYGQGLRLEDFPQILCTGLDPRLLEKMGVFIRDGRMAIPVAARVPAHLIGAGQGMGSGHSGDCDIMTADRAELSRHGLDKLRFGDVVLMENCDNTYGRGYLTGAVSVGVVVHSDGRAMGHGPGVSTLMTSKTPCIEGVLSQGANLADIMGV